MSAYIIVDATPINEEQLKEYSAEVAETLVPFGGEFLAKGPIGGLHGDTPFQIKVILAFPDHASAKGWYQSPAYQAIIPLRNEAMKSQFHIIG